MARKKAIDLEAYSMLDQYCIGLNEFYKSLRRSGFTVELSLAILLEPATYPATILPAPNWLPLSPDRIPYDDNDDED
jgi:hypothetical protein